MTGTLSASTVLPSSAARSAATSKPGQSMSVTEALRLGIVRIEDIATVWGRLFLCKYFHFDTSNVPFNQAMRHTRDVFKYVLLTK
jgi:hypothetical protein